MSRRLDGGIIGNRPNWGPDSSSGIWSLDQQISRQRTGLWPTLGDPYFDYVTLLLHCEGAHGATQITDSSSYTPSATFTRAGNAIVSNLQKRFGNTSIYCDGSGDYFTSPYLSRYTFGSGNFTIEISFYAIANGYASILDIWSATSDFYQSWTIDVSPATGYISFIADLGSLGDINMFQISNAYSLNTWVDIAITRNADTWRLFVNGILKSTYTSAPSATMDPGAGALSVGGLDGRTDYSFAGYVDQVRITKGICRYETDYVVSGSPFPNFKR